MSIDALTRWLASLAPKPPAMPPLPDLRTIAAPPGLRLIRGFSVAWDAALAEIQARVEAWAIGAWNFLVQFNARAVVEAIKLALGVGLVVGLVLGVMAGVAIYSRHVVTLANRRAIDK